MTEQHCILHPHFITFAKLTTLLGLKTNMKRVDKIRSNRWIPIFIFYILILVSTFFARKFPNGLQFALHELSGHYFPWNFNHGVALLLISLIFYKLWPPKDIQIKLFGSNFLKSLLFPSILLIAYGICGFENRFDINPHLWAILYCIMTLVYDLTEEYAWRGYLIDALDGLNWVYKSLISGLAWASWHLLIFDDFDQFGGFWVFVIFSIIVSLVLTYAAIRTKSILAPAAIHATLVRTNYVTLICFILYFLLLWRWDGPGRNNDKDLGIPCK